MNIKLGENVISIDNEELKKALENNAEELNVQTDLVIRTPDNQEIFEQNLRSNAVKTAMEMEVKKWRNELGLEFDGKTMDNLMKFYGESVKSQSTVEPSKKIEEKDKDIQSLKLQLEEKQKSLSDWENKYNKFKNDTLINSTIDGMIHEKSIIPKEDMRLILKNRLRPDVGENDVVYFKGDDGNPLKDENLTLLTSKKVSENFYSQNPNYIQNVSGGSGGSDSNEGNTNDKSIQSFINGYEAKHGKGSSNSAEFNQALNTAISNKEVIV